MPIIDGRNLKKAYGPHEILIDINISIDANERVGLIGLNGCGKSTLAKILAGIEDADDGKITQERSATIAYLAQSPSAPAQRSAKEEVLSGLSLWKKALTEYEKINQRINSSTTLSENEHQKLLHTQAEALALVEGLGGFDLDHRAESILQQLGVSSEKDLSTCSGGERRRVDIARILISQPDLAILDEPTNHLDIDTIEWLEHYLVDEFKGSLLLVTHDRRFLDNLAQRCIEIEQGKAYFYPGGYEEYIQGRAERLAQEARKEANRQNYLRQEIEWLRRQPKARTTKQKARIDRIHDAMSDLPVNQSHAVKLEIKGDRLGKNVLETKQLSVGFSNEVRLIENFDFILMRGQRVGILGKNGCGKTTFIRTLRGEQAALGGEIIIGKNTNFAYLSQTRDDLDEEKSIRENICGDRTTIKIGSHQIEIHSYLERFLFRNEDHRRPVHALSGGERSRVALAKMMSQPSNLIILDEPTNDLDVMTISALEQMLVEFNGTALVVTHDRTFLDRVATSMLVFEEGKEAPILHAGNFSAYKALTNQTIAPPSRKNQSQQKPKPKAKATQKNEETPRKLTYAEEIELGKIDGVIETLQEKIDKIESIIADPALYAHDRREEAARYNKELALKKEDMQKHMDRWEELELVKQAYNEFEAK